MTRKKSILDRIRGFSSFVWYCVQFMRFLAILLNWNRGEQAAQAVSPPERDPDPTSLENRNLIRNPSTQHSTRYLQYVYNKQKMLE